MLLATLNAIPAHCAMDLFGFEAVRIELYRVDDRRQVKVWCGVNDINPRDTIPGTDFIIVRFDSPYVSTSIPDFLAETHAELKVIQRDWREARRLCEVHVGHAEDDD